MKEIECHFVLRLGYCLLNSDFDLIIYGPRTAVDGSVLETAYLFVFVQHALKSNVDNMCLKSISHP